jgi:hypothetical protein
MGLDGVRQAEQDLTALLRAHGGPRRERGSSGRDRGVSLGPTAAGDLAEDPSVDGGHVVEGLGGRNALAADPVPGVDVDTGDADRCHEAPTRHVVAPS